VLLNDFMDYFVRFLTPKQIQMNNSLFASLPLFFLVLISCASIQPEKQGTHPISHEQFNKLLKNHVKGGKVNYAGFQKDSIQFSQYLDLLRDNPPNKTHWSKNETLAYWINAYNAFTIQLILDHYPLKSIKDIGSKIQIPFVNTPWDIKFIDIAGEKYDLNNIEHNILRKNFNEPRIHFAIVCASYSCPNLRREAYQGDKLDIQLTNQVKEFLNDSTKNRITKGQINISKIFSWFKGDFTKLGSLIDFLNKYSKTKIGEDAEVSYMEYDWSLNK